MFKVYRYDQKTKPAHIFPLLSVLIAILVIFTWFYAPARAEDPGYALVFDGINDYINLGDTGNVMGNGNWASSKSVSLWVRVTGTTPPATEPIIGEILVSTDRPRLFGVSRAVFNGQDRIWAWNSDGTGVDSVSMEFVAGEWFHVTVVHQNNVLSLYKNGFLVGSTASGVTYYPTGGIDGNLYLGGSGRSDPSLYFDGQLDEVAFWDAALTEADISYVMNAVLTEAHPLWSQLTAYYRMSDGAGTSLTDDSANTNTGVLLGGMSDVNWVISGAFDGDPLPTHTATATQPPADTSTPTSTSTNTPIPTSTSTSTATALNTATATATETAGLPPTATQTSSPTNTSTPTFTQTPTPTQTRTSTSTLLPGPSATPTSTPAISGDTLVQIGFLDTPGNPYDIEVVNGYAYIADVNGGLRIVDVSDPAHPVELGALPWPVRAYGVAIDGNYAFIADIRAGLRIMDVTNPAAPSQVGELDTPGMSFDVAVSGAYAYVADRTGGLRIIWVADPASPVEVASISTPDEALSVDVTAGYAYTAIYTAGLLTSDVRTPASPVNLSVFGSSRAYGVRVIGSNAYLADGGSGLHIINVADPSVPTLVASYNTLGWARSLRIAGNLVYIADWTAGVTVVDTTNLSRPVLLTQYQTPGKVRDVDVEGPYVYVADYDYGLRILTWQ